MSSIKGGFPHRRSRLAASLPHCGMNSSRWTRLSRSSARRMKPGDVLSFCKAPYCRPASRVLQRSTRAFLRWRRNRGPLCCANTPLIRSVPIRRVYPRALQRLANPAARRVRRWRRLAWWNNSSICGGEQGRLMTTEGVRRSIVSVTNAALLARAGSSGHCCKQAQPASMRPMASNAARRCIWPPGEEMWR